MREPFIEAIVEKLMLLEEKTGHKVGYRMMPPAARVLGDVIDVQALAREIAVFLGLEDLTFIVTLRKQQENVAGHIELSGEDPIVFVEVERQLLNMPRSLAATLCHELTHKWLHRNGIHLPLTQENEILTDIATVYLGLGKVMLNGTVGECEHVTQTREGTYRTPQQWRFGYLSQGALAFTYRLVCAMRKIPSHEYLEGLTQRAADAVQKCDRAYQAHYSGRYHCTEARADQVRAYEEVAVEVQKTIAELDKHVNYLRKRLVQSLEEFVRDAHRSLQADHEQIRIEAQREEPDRALQFLRTLKNEAVTERSCGRAMRLKRRASRFLEYTNRLGAIVTDVQAFPLATPEIFRWPCKKYCVS